MSQKLTYPGFSVVFIQTFSIHHTKEFILPERAVKEMFEKFEEKDEEKKVYWEKADALQTPIAWVERRDIENLIFSLPKNSPYERMPSVKKRIFQRPRRMAMKGNVWRYSLRGFDFTMPIVPAKDTQYLFPYYPPPYISGTSTVAYQAVSAGVT